MVSGHDLIQERKIGTDEGIDDRFGRHFKVGMFLYLGLVGLCILEDERFYLRKAST